MTGSKSEFRVGPDGDPDRYVLGGAVASGAEGILYRGWITTTTGLELPVAIKMLQPRFLPQVEEWHARWSEQVEVLRSLQVPGVVRVRDGFLGPLPHAVGGTGEGRTLYLVMNWVEGEPLDEWVRKRPDRRPLDALKLLLGVAAALDLMHSGGATGGVAVVHRDVKPSNILVTEEGTVLVDFGLTRGLPDGQRLSGITGTPGYLAPEATKAGHYTPATDRYALGGVAFFVITGTEPPTTHEPEAMRTALAAVPELRGRPETVDHIMAMLDADPDGRPVSLANWIGQLRRSSLTGLPDVLAPQAPRRNPRPSPPNGAGRRGQARLGQARRRRPAVLAGGAMAVAVAAGAIAAWPTGSGEGRLEAAGPPGSRQGGPAGSVPAAGAQVEQIAFIRSNGPASGIAPKIFLMNADGSNQRAVAETTQGSGLSWSPDGKRIAFGDVGGIYIVNADGSGETRVETGDASEQWPTWSPDGTRLAFRSLRNFDQHGGGIYSVKLDGSDLRRLTENSMDIGPAWSPDGRKIVFARADSWMGSIVVMNADGTAQTSVAPGGDSPAWAPDSRRIAYRSSSTIAVLDTSGGAPQQVASPGGTLAVDPAGRGADKLAAGGGDPANPSWSPDGTTIAYTLFRPASPPGSSCSIVAVDASGANQRNLTDGAFCDTYPAWQPAAR